MRVKSKYGWVVDLGKERASEEILADCESEGTLASLRQAPAECGAFVLREFASAVVESAPEPSCVVPPETKKWLGALWYARSLQRFRR